MDPRGVQPSCVLFCQIWAFSGQLWDSQHLAPPSSQAVHSCNVLSPVLNITILNSELTLDQRAASYRSALCFKSDHIPPNKNTDFRQQSTVCRYAAGCNHIDRLNCSSQKAGFCKLSRNIGLLGCVHKHAHVWGWCSIEVCIHRPNSYGHWSVNFIWYE